MRTLDLACRAILVNACALLIAALPAGAQASRAPLESRRPHLLPAWRVPAVVAALGGHGEHALRHLLEACRRSYRAATVTSGFADARGVSRYRKSPGLHLGYDVAMPAGTPVRCAWPGTVVRVTPWSETEWGITVRHEDGSEATYGHLSTPATSIGDRVPIDRVLGLVAIDHVDVKMRDADGRPLDFGAVSETSGDVTADWLRARFAAAEASDRLHAVRSRTATIRRSLSAPRDDGQKDALRLEAGLISLREAERRAQARARAQDEQRLAQRTAEVLEAEVTQLTAQVAATKQALARAEMRARAAGKRWSDVEQRIAAHLERDATLRAKVARARAMASAERPSPSTVRPNHASRLEALYREGVVSRRQLEIATGRAAPALTDEQPD